MLKETLIKKLKEGREKARHVNTTAATDCYLGKPKLVKHKSTLKLIAKIKEWQALEEAYYLEVQECSRKDFIMDVLKVSETYYYNCQRKYNKLVAAGYLNV